MTLHGQNLYSGTDKRSQLQSGARCPLICYICPSHQPPSSYDIRANFANMRSTIPHPQPKQEGEAMVNLKSSPPPLNSRRFGGLRARCFRFNPSPPNSFPQISQFSFAPDPHQTVPFKPYLETPNLTWTASPGPLPPAPAQPSQIPTTLTGKSTPGTFE